VAAIRDAWK